MISVDRGVGGAFDETSLSLESVTKISNDLLNGKRGPRGPHRFTAEKQRRVAQRLGTGLSIRHAARPRVSRRAPLARADAEGEGSRGSGRKQG